MPFDTMKINHYVTETGVVMIEITPHVCVNIAAARRLGLLK